MSKAKKPGSRVFSLAKMSMNVVADIASYKAKALLHGKDDPKAKSQLNYRIGQEIATTLSEMKGPLMKVGQIFAQVKDVLPPEISEALGQLRQYAQPIELELIQQQIFASFGAYPDTLFESFDSIPYRSASLGQVHRARLKSGEDVVVKVQYPGMADACESDIKHLKNIFRLLPLMGIDRQALNVIFLEIEEVISRELDYRAEVSAMQEFYIFFKDSDRVIVPYAFTEFSSSTVITMSYEQGESLESVQRIRSEGRGDCKFIQTVSQNLFYCLAEQIFMLRRIHVDPHAGNFAVKPDGRLIMFDFGAVKTLEVDVVTMFKKVVEAMLCRDIAVIEALLLEKHIRRSGTSSLGVEFYDPWLNILNAPFLCDEYDFVQAKIHIEAVQLAKKNWRFNQSHFLPSRDTLQLDRLIVGHYWNFLGLKVAFSMRHILEKYIEFPKK